MDLSSPNRLLRLFIEHDVQTVPICEQGRVTGRIQKKDMVRYLSRSKHFEMTVQRTIEDLVEPAEEDLLEDLRGQLKEGSINAIPIVSRDGEHERTITPDVLEQEESSAEFLEQTEQFDQLVSLLRQAPFELTLELDAGELNLGFNQEDQPEKVERAAEWATEEGSGELRLPQPAGRVLDALLTLRNGDSIDMRQLIDELEETLMKLANQRHDTKSATAESLGIPRQTFNYRWDQLQEPGEGEE